MYYNNNRCFNALTNKPAGFYYIIMNKKLGGIMSHEELWRSDDSFLVLKEKKRERSV